MSNQRYSPEFKDEAVRQIVDRGYSVAEVSPFINLTLHSRDDTMGEWKGKLSTSYLSRALLRRSNSCWIGWGMWR